MKIYTITAVLCIATTALANQGPSNNIEKGQTLARRAASPQGKQSEVYRLHTDHNEHGVEAHRDGDRHNSDNGGDYNVDDNKGKNGGKKGGDKKAGGSEGGEGKKNGGEGKQGEDKKGGGQGKGTDGKAPVGTGSDTGNDPKQGGHQGAAPANGKPPVAGTPAKPANGKPPVVGTPANPANGDAPVAGAPTKPATDDSNIPHDYASPLWLVQPFGASIWAQGIAYVISWGPNPDPLYSKKLADKTTVDVSLMQGPPEELKEIAVLTKDVDSSLNSFTWTVPTTVPPAKDYSIRLSHQGQIDTYSHYFEIAAAGDPRSSMSNVGEPLEMPQMGDVPKPLDDVSQPLDKNLKPNMPPNPPPANKPATTAPPAAAKPVKHTSSAVVGSQSVNMLAFAMTLFGAVYLL
ncbi:hypothetical protein BG006_001787 [Podila minutissima]|uniref:Yeast cell wall synthesis Kre9/Knh1-like N-terminal domain-containing protein n=1 Tax=Podila minutissima TaxID=64525 RepID=A0A9P5VNY4_9FUNG|nr:hypothetical protein BG006_001787 [Podila minutissima]